MVNENSEPAKVIRPGPDIDQSRIFNVPGVVLLIAGLCIAVHILLGFAPRRFAWSIEIAAALSPEMLLAGVKANGGPLRMISPLFAHMFVHGNLMHLLFNSIWLLAFGAPVARRMGADNALQGFSAFAAASLFMTFYLLSGVAGALTYVALHANESTLLIGASGGVSGLLGGVVRFAFNRTTLMGPEFARLSPLSSRPVITWTIAVIFMNVIFGTVGAGMTGSDNVAWEAHIGGFLFGLVSYPFFERLARSWQA